MKPRRGSVHRRSYTVEQWRAFADGLTQRDSKRYELAFQGVTALTALLSMIEALSQIAMCATHPISLIEPHLVSEHVGTLIRTVRIYSSLHVTYANSGFHVRRSNGTYRYVTRATIDAPKAECRGHFPGPNDPPGAAVYCDGSCRSS